MIRGDAIEGRVRQLLRGVIVVDLGNDVGIEAGNIGSDAEGGIHKTAASGAGAAAPGACAAGAAPAAGTACRAARCAGDYAGIYASHNSACLGAQNVHLRDGQVIARDDDVEVVLESEIDCVLQRKIELAIADE